MLQVKRFLRNKNTVTVLGVILIVGILFAGYVIQINRATSPVRDIPVAAQTIQPRTEITSDMIKYIDVASIMVGDRVIRSSGQIIGKYSKPQYKKKEPNKKPNPPSPPTTTIKLYIQTFS